jgi:UPF0755 protein
VKEEDQEKQAPQAGPAVEAPRRRWPRHWPLAALAAFFLAAGLAWWWMASYAAAVPPRAGEADIIVYIPPDVGFAGIKKCLTEQQVIGDDIRFDLLARWMRARDRMRAGEYSFAPGLTHREIIRKLTRGEVHYRPLTIPEGYNVFQIGDLLASGFGYDRQEFLRQVQDPDYIRSLGLEAPSLEGYLFPDTYFITRGQKLDAVIAMMVRRFHEVFTEIGGVDMAAAFSAAHAISPHGIVILASIIEKETALPAERPLIAAVFLNRLQQKMKLQADPTVIYGIAGFNGNLTRQDLATPSPYNTYTNEGLPAGPIANPGKASLAAVLHPAQTDYLYFVAKNDGSHHFSSSLGEHNSAVARLQKQKKEAANETESELEKSK